MESNEEKQQKTTDQTTASSESAAEPKQPATASSTDQSAESSATEAATTEKATETTEANSEAPSNAERNQKASARQAKNRARQVTFKDVATMSTTEMRAELTNKNTDYIFKMHKLLVEAGYAPEDADAKINGFLPEIIKAQRTGQPANQLYGAPTVKVENIIHAPAKPITLKYWMRSVDWSLLYLVILAAVFGLMGLFMKKQTSTAANSGLGTLIVMSIAFGFLLTWFTDNMDARRNKNKSTADEQNADADDKKKKQPLWRVILLSVVGVFAVMVLISFMTVVTPALNPVLPAYGYFLVAALAYGGRYLFRRRYHIKGRLM
ncbi:DUF1129 family protein [Lapidilactobacillus wuchangensis]|uniref:DUF1129 family protein n=1 Tax=Lapidilactobacillus wuchangensis TaxID=2486001 RepID=UPI000F76F460|nr:DUF1129 family protein [Lapidilactobacillus wuchangensis]